MHPLRGAVPFAVCASTCYSWCFWLLIGTRSRLLVVGLLSIAEPLNPSRCLFGTILVTLCLMVWDWRVSRAEPMLSRWHDLLFLFCLLLFYLFLPSIGWLCGVVVFGLIECSHSLLVLHSRLQLIITIIIIISQPHHVTASHPSPGDHHQSSGGRSERTQGHAIMAAWNSFSYICTRALHSLRSFVHCVLCPKSIPIFRARQKYFFDSVGDRHLGLEVLVRNTLWTVLDVNV